MFWKVLSSRGVRCLRLEGQEKWHVEYVASRPFVTKTGEKY